MCIYANKTKFVFVCWFVEAPLPDAIMASAIMCQTSYFYSTLCDISAQIK